jgi:hypothetical protein
MIFEGVVRRFFPLKGGKGPLDARQTHLESLAVGQVEAPGFEMTRAGRRFYIAYTGAVPTGIAPVQAFPTTAAQWLLWNADKTQSLIFRTLGALLFSGTQGLGGQLLAAIVNLPATVGNSSTGLAVASASGSARASKVTIKASVVITDPAAPNWFPIAEDIGAAARVGPLCSIINRAIEGKVVVPPLQGLALAVLAPAGTTPLYLPVGDWEEAESDLE